MKYALICFTLFSVFLYGDEQPNFQNSSYQLNEEFNSCEMDENFQGSYSDYENNWDLWTFPNYFTLGYTGGRGLSYHRGYTELGIFSAPSYFAIGQFVPFADVRGYAFDQGKWATNVGLGIRTPLSCWDVVAGMNIYYDYRNFHSRHLNQIGIGFELLSALGDLRINGYIPVGDFNQRHKKLYGFGDDLYFATSEWAQAFRGFDIELGAWLLKKSSCNFVGIYFAAGSYYYSRDHKKISFHDKHRSFTGGRARILAKINDYVEIAVNGTYDNYYHGTLQGQITLNIPFNIWEKFKSENCPPPPCLIDQLMIQPVERNGIIVAHHDCTMEWNWSGACPCSCEESCSCSSSSSGCSGLPTSRSWDSDRFCSDYFRYPYSCSECRSSSSSSCY